MKLSATWKENGFPFCFSLLVMRIEKKSLRSFGMTNDVYVYDSFVDFFIFQSKELTSDFSQKKFLCRRNRMMNAYLPLTPFGSFALTLSVSPSHHRLIQSKSFLWCFLRFPFWLSSGWPIIIWSRTKHHLKLPLAARVMNRSTVEIVVFFASNEFQFRFIW